MMRGLLFLAALAPFVLVSSAYGYCTIGGCDETSEVLSWQGQSWIVNGTPSPGVCPTLLGHHHILITEVCVGGPDGGEFVEIANTIGVDLYLKNIWLTDDCNNNDNDYVNIVNNGPWSFPADDFIARFPIQETLPNNSCIVVAPDGNKFFNAYGFYPDFEIKPVSEAKDMITIGAHGNAGSPLKIVSAREAVFHASPVRQRPCGRIAREPRDSIIHKCCHIDMVAIRAYGNGVSRIEIVGTGKAVFHASPVRQSSSR